MYLYSKNIYLPNQVKKTGFLLIEDGKIKDIVNQIEEGILFEDYSDYLLIPGFIDQHLHGWGTGSFTSKKSKKSIYEMQKHLPEVGVTSFLATSGAEPIEDLVHGIKICGEIMNEENTYGSTLLGVHLEGPFVSRKNKGMMNEDYFKEPSLEIMKRFVNAQVTDGTIKLMTMAIELPGSKEVIQFCHKNGIQVSVGVVFITVS